MSAPKGYSSQEKDDRLSAQFATIEPVRELQNGLTVSAHQFVRSIASDAVESGSTSSVIVATSHLAIKGDVIHFTSGSFLGREVKVWDTAANSITLAETLSGIPAIADTFDILRHKYPICDSSGALVTTAAEVATAADGGALPALLKVMGGYDGAAVQVIKTDSAGELQVDVLSSALPTGAATESTLSTINTKTPALGQAAMVASVPVVVSSDQSGIPVTDNGGSLTVDGTIAATQSGAWNITNITGTVSLPTGAATAAKQPALGTAGTASADVITVQGIASMVALKVDGSAVTQPISAATLPLPSGAATESTLSTINTKIPALGQAAMATSTPVVIASNQSGIPVTDNGGSLTVDGAVTVSGTVAVNGISGTVSLPTGAATASNQGTMINYLQTMDADTSALAGCVNGAYLNVIPNSLSVVDLLDAGILDTSSTNIAGSSSSPTQVVSSLAAGVKKIQLLDTTGAFIGVYVGAVGVEVLQFVMGPGSDQTIEHVIPALSRISLKRLDSTTAVSSGIVAINFIG